MADVAAVGGVIGCRRHWRSVMVTEGDEEINNSGRAGEGGGESSEIVDDSL